MDMIFKLLALASFLACTVLFMVSYFTEAPVGTLVFWGVALLANQAAFNQATKDD